MSVVMSLYLVALFVALTPGVLISLPPKGKKLTVALTHAVVFAVVYQLTHKMVARALEGFAVNVITNPASMSSSSKPATAAPKASATAAAAKPTTSKSGGMQMITF